MGDKTLQERVMDLEDEVGYLNRKMVDFDARLSVILTAVVAKRPVVKKKPVRVVRGKASV